MVEKAWIEEQRAAYVSALIALVPENYAADDLLDRIERLLMDWGAERYDADELETITQSLWAGLATAEGRLDTLERPRFVVVAPALVDATPSDTCEQCRNPLGSRTHALRCVGERRRVSAPAGTAIDSGAQSATALDSPVAPVVAPAEPETAFDSVEHPPGPPGVASASAPVDDGEPGESIETRGDSSASAETPATASDSPETVGLTSADVAERTRRLSELDAEDAAAALRERPGTKGGARFCRECGSGGRHRWNCSLRNATTDPLEPKPLCDECGTLGRRHKSGCSKAKSPTCASCGHHPASFAHQQACGKTKPRVRNRSRAAGHAGVTLDSPDRAAPAYGAVGLTDGEIYPIAPEGDAPVQIVDTEGTRLWNEYEGDHLHIWKAPAPNDEFPATSLGRCMACAIVREFDNRIEVAA